MKQDEFNVIGKVTPRKDGVSKVTGETRYASDIRLPRMLHARIVASPYAHARIVSVDTRAAEAMGAVCLTFDDIPHVRYNERIITVPWALHKDRYILAEKVRRMGEAVAAVAAETEALAEAAARAVVVEYEPLPVVTDPIEAMKPGAEPLYDTVLFGDKEIRIQNNIACERLVEEGDVDRAFAEADIILGGTFTTPKVYHSQMETKSVVCRPEGDGGITVWPTAQSIHNVRIVLGQLFGIPLSKVSVVKVPVGGTFGSSIQMNTPVPICVALALKARRPVKLTLTREEDMHDHSNFPAHIEIKIAAKRDGTLTGAQADLVTDIGAHILQAYSFLGVSVGWMASLYKFRNIRYRGRAVYTNKVPSCAMQGFGNPQMTFAVESLIDELAEKLGMDPIELRLKNYVGLGDTFWGQGPQVRSVIQSDGVQQLLRRGAELISESANRRMQRISESANQRISESTNQRISEWRISESANTQYPIPGTSESLSPRHRSGARVPHVERGRAEAERCDRLLRRDGEGQPGRLGRHRDGADGSRRRHAGGAGQARRRNAVRAVGKGQPGPGRDVLDRVRRYHACHPRRLRGRRRGGQGGEADPQGADRDGRALHELHARRADHPAGRGARAGRDLLPVRAGGGDDHRRGGPPLLDRQLEDDRGRGQLPPHQLPAGVRDRVRGGRDRYLDRPGAHAARGHGQRLRHGDQPRYGRGPARRRAVEGRGLCALRG